MLKSSILIPFVEGGEVVMFACLMCSNTCLTGDITLCAQEAGRDKDIENTASIIPDLPRLVYTVQFGSSMQIKLHQL